MGTTVTEGPECSGEGLDERVTVTVHLRAAPSTAGARRQQTVLERLRTLDAAGTIPDLTVERWSARVTVPVFEDDSDDAGAVELFEEFETISAETSIRLTPFFESREAVGGLLSSGPAASKILIFPVVSVTFRQEDELIGLYPCWKSGVHQRVEDCLDALSAGEEIKNL